MNFNDPKARFVTSEREITESTDTDLWRRDVMMLFPAAIRPLLIIWAMAAVTVSLATIVLSEETSHAAVVISFASGMVAVASMLVATVLLRYGCRRRPERDPMREFFAAAVVGMVSRVLGTVALFLTCRYHMAATAEMIVALTIGWYILLTSAEVLILARELTKISVSSATGMVGAIKQRVVAADTP